ncbi:SDR family NAD(P)-dependent oxidoreductase [Streptomyces griseocarneus]|uniref:SDR family NAD(P)-dependent oxidoreductase n=1 Tax=Streptomyces griseocarneus TaxID=51201 RepID=UPI00167DE10B|nr:SDR family NAD(P)-dependent oxidoreductase [Streptomyces griseocarneus]MBZ6477197.1 SDR family NAD(P)-dependent oxidoreductase [Streptomyces griseocarneus]GHG54020.1 short-chain dehydrogenase [Streptomyces griseocarneus]
MRDLENKVAVITGAASGIGRGMAEAFVDAGMRVVLSDVEEAALLSTTAGLRDRGADVHAVVTDVSKAADVTSLAASTLGKYGAVHVLCNNAGVYAGSKPSWESTPDDWAWILGVNLMGVVHGIQAFLPAMIEQDEDAHIVNTASVAGLMTGGSLYGATKSAVVALSETIHLELVGGGHKPRVSVLCPGLVDTNIFHSQRNRPARFPDAGPFPGGWSTEAARKAFKLGTSPRTIGERVIEAMREERFYVLTHPEWAEHIRHRTTQILSGDAPTLLPPPGT